MHTPRPTFPKSVLISAGGTGGHIFPGIALGQALARLAPDVPVYYVCGNRPLEQRLYQSESIEPEILPSSALSGGILKKVGAVLRLVANTLRAVGLVRRRKVGVVVGFGGYTTGPVLGASLLLRRPIVLHEANAVPGKANRLMARWATVVTGHFQSSLDGLKGRNQKVVGMPLRQRPNPPRRSEAHGILGLDPARRTLMITGGSQGARTLNQKTLAALRQLDLLPNQDFQVLWATGHNHHAEVMVELEKQAFQFLQIHAVPFVERMDAALLVADAAIARAGASTVAELLAAGVFPCLIPFPYAVHNHQVRNAQVLQDMQAAWMIEERDLTPEIMTDTLRRLFDKIRKLPPGARKAPPAVLDSTLAAERLAAIVLDQIGWKASQ